MQPDLRSDRHNPCAYDGNPDLYGIGIRVGIYLQWTAQLLVTLLLPEDETGTVILNSLLQAAVILGIFVLTSKDEQQLAEADVLIAFWLLIGPMSSLNPRRLNPFASWLGLARILTATATAAYYCWFWFVGWSQLPLAPRQQEQEEQLPGLSCTRGSVVAFLGGVSVESMAFRYFSAVVVTIGLTVCAVLIGTRIARPSKPKTWWKRRIELDVDFVVEASLLFVSILTMLVSIAMVEYLIVANRIGSVNDVQSIGQLIALLTGALSLGSVIQKLVKGFRIRMIDEEERCGPRWQLFGH